MKNRTAVLLFLLSASAFAADTTVRVDVSTDPASRDTRIATRTLSTGVGSNFLDTATVTVYLGGTLHPGRGQDYYLDVVYTGGDWKHLNSAIDADAITLPLSPLDQHVVGPRKVLEHLRLGLSRDYLDQHVDKGLALTLQGRESNAAFTVPPAFVHDFLVTVDDTLHGKPGSPGVPATPSLGAQLVPLQAAFAHVLGLPAPAGMLVAAVAPGGLGDRLGLQQGDVLLKLGDAEVNNDADLLRAETALDPGVVAQCWRSGHALTLQLH